MSRPLKVLMPALVLLFFCSCGSDKNHNGNGNGESVNGSSGTDSSGTGTSGGGGTPCGFAAFVCAGDKPPYSGSWVITFVFGYPTCPGGQMHTMREISKCPVGTPIECCATSATPTGWKEIRRRTCGCCGDAVALNDYKTIERVY